MVGNKLSVDARAIEQGTHWSESDGDIVPDDGNANENEKRSGRSTTQAANAHVRRDGTSEPCPRSGDAEKGRNQGTRRALVFMQQQIDTPGGDWTSLGSGNRQGRVVE